MNLAGRLLLLALLLGGLAYGSYTFANHVLNSQFQLIDEPPAKPQYAQVSKSTRAAPPKTRRHRLEGNTPKVEVDVLPAQAAGPGPLPPSYSSVVEASREKAAATSARPERVEQLRQPSATATATPTEVRRRRRRRRPLPRSTPEDAQRNTAGELARAEAAGEEAVTEALSSSQSSGGSTPPAQPTRRPPRSTPRSTPRRERTPTAPRKKEDPSPVPRPEGDHGGTNSPVPQPE